MLLKLNNAEDKEQYFIRPNFIAAVIRLEKCSRLILEDGTELSADEDAEWIVRRVRT